MNKILLIISFVLLSNSAQSQSSDEANNLWKFLDTNIDGMISRAEAASDQEILEKWNSLDINKDDELDVTEFSQIFLQEE